MTNRKWIQAFLLIPFFLLASGGYAQDSLSLQQKKILKTMEHFSATTAPDGAGADAYGSFLAEDFSRWTIGSKTLSDKQKWVEGVRAWFDDGWRVSKRETKNMDIRVDGNFAFTRRVVTETYLGPTGETSSSKAALAEVWIYREAKWLLYRVDVHPIPGK